MGLQIKFNRNRVVKLSHLWLVGVVVHRDVYITDFPDAAKGLMQILRGDFRGDIPHQQADISVITPVTAAAISRTRSHIAVSPMRGTVVMPSGRTVVSPVVIGWTVVAPVVVGWTVVSPVVIGWTISVPGVY